MLNWQYFQCLILNFGHIEFIAEKKINICNNFTSREEATLLGLESAFNTYNENNKQDEKQTSKLS